ncbi:MAG: TerB family tellurite resistance protein [Deltaproteobacteria bacterium]|nr:TerB family tellurite resistance protein [Deltaproteobacteria bacterium]
MSLWELLGLKRKPAEDAAGDRAETRTVREIIQTLDALPAEEARFVASFAYLLSRVAHADLDISSRETDEMERIVVQVGGLSEAQAAVVVQMAKTHTRLFGGTEDFLVAREFGKLARPDQKRALLRCLFAVSAADETISSVEDNAIKQIADELRIDRDEVNAMRSEFKDFLASLRPSSPGREGSGR